MLSEQREVLARILAQLGPDDMWTSSGSLGCDEFHNMFLGIADEIMDAGFRMLRPTPWWMIFDFEGKMVETTMFEEVAQEWVNKTAPTYTVKQQYQLVEWREYVE